MPISKYLTLLTFAFVIHSSHSQNFQSSNLPIVVINTSGQEIQDEPKIPAHMGIIDNASGTNSKTDAYNNYDGKITIELRGASSLDFSKKGYGFELKDDDDSDRSEELMGLPEEEDWVLHGPYSDKSLIRNILAFHLWDATGRYGSRTHLCELVINDDYKGVYVLMENVKRDENRVDISNLGVDENTGDDLTGGYIIKIDKSGDGGFPSQHTPQNSQGWQQIYYFYEYPKPDEITLQQRNYISDYVEDFENSLASDNFKSTDTGYRKFTNISSFIDLALLNELSRNVDGYRLSTYLFKDKDSKGGKLNVGPPWDYNLSFGNADYCDGYLTSGWAWDFNMVCDFDYWQVPFWWSRFLEDEYFRSMLRLRWESLRADDWSNESIMAFIDDQVSELAQPQARNRQRWPEVNGYIWPNANYNTTYSADIQYLKSWITERLEWMDSEIGKFEIIVLAQDEISADDLVLFPNPVGSSLTIISNGKIGNLEIADLSGRVLISQAVDSRRSGMDVSTLAAGSYVLRATVNSVSVSKVLIKE